MRSCCTSASRWGVSTRSCDLCGRAIGHRPAPTSPVPSLQVSRREVPTRTHLGPSQCSTTTRHSITPAGPGLACLSHRLQHCLRCPSDRADQHFSAFPASDESKGDLTHLLPTCRNLSVPSSHIRLTTSGTFVGSSLQAWPPSAPFRLLAATALVRARVSRFRRPHCLSVCLQQGPCRVVLSAAGTSLTIETRDDDKLPLLPRPLSSKRNVGTSRNVAPHRVRRDIATRSTVQQRGKRGSSQTAVAPEQTHQTEDVLRLSLAS